MAAMPPQAPILIVDDDQKSLFALRELLQDLDAELVLAASGEDALRHALRRDFAVILLDARMPGVDGFDTARLIRGRERSRHTPIMFLTGAYEDGPSMFRGYEAGAVDYITKPLVPEVLKSKISVFIDLYRKSAVLSQEIAERKRAEGHLRASEEQLRALAAQLRSVREQERIRIAREIHDELGQALTAIKMDLTWIVKRLPPDSAVLLEKARSTFGLIDDTIRSVREIATRLRPEVLDQLGLAAAIEWQARDFQMRTGIRCVVNLPDTPITLDQERSTAVFRIFQELLTNVARHAEATRVDVRLEAGGERLLLEVHDNGRGIPANAMDNPRSLGLLGMRERVLPFQGGIEIIRSPTRGACLRVSIPIAR